MSVKRLVFGIVIPIVSCANTPDQSHSIPYRPPIVNTKNDTLSYEQLKNFIDSTRLAFKKEYLESAEGIRKEILKKASGFIINAISEDLFYHWENTPWDFNGVTKKPKTGTIACGYFVTTLLQDAGYSLNRVKLSTSPSMLMMKELTSFKDIKNLSRLSYPEFVEYIKGNGKGLLVVGLDFHTGFIVHDDMDMWFIHSNYINSAGVMKEKLSESFALKSSKTRYITDLTANEKFLRTWLLN